MSKKMVAVALDGKTYQVPKFTLAQHRELLDIFKGADADASFRILGMALARAEPPVPDVMELEATIDEIKAAVEKILVHSGYKPAEASVPNG